MTQRWSTTLAHMLSVQQGFALEEMCIGERSLSIEPAYRTFIEVDTKGPASRPWQVWVRSYDRTMHMIYEDEAGQASVLDHVVALVVGAHQRMVEGDRWVGSVTEPLHCDFTYYNPRTPHTHDQRECSGCGSTYHCAGSTRCPLNGAR